MFLGYSKKCISLKMFQKLHFCLVFINQILPHTWLLRIYMKFSWNRLQKGGHIVQVNCWRASTSVSHSHHEAFAIWPQQKYWSCRAIQFVRQECQNYVQLKPPLVVNIIHVTELVKWTRVWLFNTNSANLFITNCKENDNQMV